MSYPSPQPGLPPASSPYPGSPYPQNAPMSFPPFQQPLVVHVPPTSGAATASLVLGIIGLVGGWCAFGIPCILAVIFGHVGLIQTRNGVRGGRGMAVAGLVMGYLLVLPGIVFSALFLGAVIADMPSQ